MTDLHTLLSDIQSATGPNGELDARIYHALTGVTFALPAAFTSSLDAIAAATRERFPNGTWAVKATEHGGFANVQTLLLSCNTEGWIEGKNTFPQFAATPELAFCAALIAAVTGEMS